MLHARSAMQQQRALLRFTPAPLAWSSILAPISAQTRCHSTLSRVSDRQPLFLHSAVDAYGQRGFRVSALSLAPRSPPSQQKKKKQQQQSSQPQKQQPKHSQDPQPHLPTAATVSAEPAAATAAPPVDSRIFPVPVSSVSSLSFGRGLALAGLEVGMLFLSGCATFAGVLLAQKAGAPVSVLLVTQHTLFAATYAALTWSSNRSKRWQWMHLPPADPAASARLPIANLRSGRSWLRIGLLLVGGVVSLVLLSVLPNVFADDIQAVEDPHVLSLAMEADTGTLLAISLTGPVLEEVIFRGLLFARTLRMFGLAPAIAIQFVVFGMMHYSEHGEKVLQSGLMGVVFAALYRASGTLLLPSAVHVINNTLVTARMWQVSPFRIDYSKRPEDAVATTSEALDQPRTSARRAIYRIKTKLGLLRVPTPGPWDEPQLGNIYSWLQEDLHTLQPPVAALSDAIFTALDRGGKGWLSADELAFAKLLSSSERISMAAALGAIQQRQNELLAEGAAPQEKVDPATLLDLPSQHFLAPEQQSAARALVATVLDGEQQLHELLPPPSKKAVWLPAVHVELAAVQQELRTASLPSDDAAGDAEALRMQTSSEEFFARLAGIEQFHRYYSHEERKKYALLCRRYQLTHLTREGFQRLLAEELMMPREGAEWLAAMTRTLQGQQAHSGIFFEVSADGKVELRA